jgi:hypothetical protein
LRNGDVVKLPSISILLAEGPNDAATRAAYRSLLRVSEELALLVQAGATAEVDFGLFVSANGTQSVHLDGDLLRLLEGSGASLAVRAYPCSD